jgi:hypothetical protein
MDLTQDVSTFEGISKIACKDNTGLYLNVKNSAKFDVKIGYAIVDIAGMDFTNFILSCDFKAHLSNFTLYWLYTPNPIIFIILVYFTRIGKFGIPPRLQPRPAPLYIKGANSPCKHF